MLWFFFTLTDSGTLCHLFSSLKIAFKTQNVSLEVTIEAVKIFRKFQSFFWFSSQSSLATVIVCGGHKEVTSFTENKKIKTNTSQATYQGHTLDFSLIFFFFPTPYVLSNFSFLLDVFIGVWVFHTVQEKVAVHIPSFSLLMKMCSHRTTRRMEKYG